MGKEAERGDSPLVAGRQGDDRVAGAKRLAHGLGVAIAGLSLAGQDQLPAAVSGRPMVMPGDGRARQTYPRAPPIQTAATNPEVGGESALHDFDVPHLDRNAEMCHWI